MSERTYPIASDYTPTPEAVEAAARAAALVGRVYQDGLTPEQQAERDWQDEEYRDSALGRARAALTAAGPLIAAEALEGQQGIYGESPAAGDVMMPPETLMQRMEADGRHWRNAYAEGFLSGQVSALRGFADTTRFPSHWVLFRRPDGSGVTVSDLLRETAARMLHDSGGGGDRD